MEILTIDDDAMTCKIMGFVFEDEGYVAHSAASVAAARAILAAHQPDLILLDVNLPDGDGFEFCRQLRAEGVTQPIIFLTGRGEISSRTSGLDLGADDYIVKPFDAGEVLARVHSVMRRARSAVQAGYQPRLRAAGLELDTIGHQLVLSDDDAILLTPTETRLLECLMRHMGMIVSRDILIEWVWGYYYEGNSNRIEVYIRRLRQKMGEKKVTQWAIETARGSGYRLLPVQEQSRRHIS